MSLSPLPQGRGIFVRGWRGEQGGRSTRIYVTEEVAIRHFV